MMDIEHATRAFAYLCECLCDDAFDSISNSSQFGGKVELNEDLEEEKDTIRFNIEPIY